MGPRLGVEGDPHGPGLLAAMRLRPGDTRQRETEIGHQDAARSRRHLPRACLAHDTGTVDRRLRDAEQVALRPRGIRDDGARERCGGAGDGREPRAHASPGERLRTGEGETVPAEQPKDRLLERLVIHAEHDVAEPLDDLPDERLEELGGGRDRRSFGPWR